MYRNPGILYTSDRTSIKCSRPRRCLSASTALCSDQPNARKSAVGLSTKAAMCSRLNRSSRTTSAVVQLPRRIQMTLGGEPRRTLNRWKSSSFVTGRTLRRLRTARLCCPWRRRGRVRERDSNPDKDRTRRTAGSPPGSRRTGVSRKPRAWPTIRRVSEPKHWPTDVPGQRRRQGKRGYPLG